MENIEQGKQVETVYLLFFSLMSGNLAEFGLNLIIVRYHLAIYVTHFPFFSEHVESRGHRSHFNVSFPI